MRKAIVSIFLTLTLLFPAITAAQEVTEVPTDSAPVAEVTPEPAPVEPIEEELPEEDGSISADELTAVFGIPVTVAIVFSGLGSLVIAALKKFAPEHVGNWEITARGISVFVALVTWGIYWAFGRFGFEDEFIQSLNFIIDIGPTAMSLLAIVLSQSGWFRIFKFLRVPILGDPLPTQDEINSQARNRNKAYESAG